MLLGKLFEKKQDFLIKQKEWTLRVFYYDITEEYALAQCDNKCSIDGTYSNSEKTYPEEYTVRDLWNQKVDRFFWAFGCLYVIINFERNLLSLETLKKHKERLQIKERAFFEENIITLKSKDYVYENVESLIIIWKNLINELKSINNEISKREKVENNE